MAASDMWEAKAGGLLLTLGPIVMVGGGFGAAALLPHTKPAQLVAFFLMGMVTAEIVFLAVFVPLVVVIGRRRGELLPRATRGSTPSG